MESSESIRRDHGGALDLTRDALAEALRVELRQALGSAGVPLNRNTIAAIARRVAQQVVTYPTKSQKAVALD